MKLASIDEVLEDVRAGRPIVLVDDADRENEGDLMVAAEKLTLETLTFMMNEGKGLVCLSLTEEQLKQLEIPLQVVENTSGFGTNFAVSFDHHSVVANGVTAASRLVTMLEAVRPDARPEQFVTPGYVFPVCARPGGVLKRRGQTEGSVDISRIAGLIPAGVICEVMGEQGQMLRGQELSEYCRKHSLKCTSVEEIVRYRLHHEVSIRRVAELTLDKELGLERSAELEALASKYPGVPLKVMVYVDDVDGKEHMALVKGSPKDGALVRIHSECLTGDVFTSGRCDCGDQLNQALAMVLERGEGIIVYLHQEGRGIGLGNKLRAYELQDSGLDTVDANLSLGFAADAREYRVGAQILLDLGVQQVRLMTNNPDKITALENLGITVISREPLPVPMHEHNAAYLTTKRTRLGHLIPSE